MNPNRFTPARLAALAGFLVASTTGALAQPAPAPFPEGVPISLYVGTAAGGTNDMIMRLVSEHLGKYLPGNPTVLARNMPGAGGRNLAAYIYNRAPRDGTEIGVVQRALSIAPLVEDDVHFRMDDMTWIGSSSRATDVCLVWHESPIQSLEDMQEQELILAGSGGEAGQVATLQRLTGARIRAVIGYEGGAQMMLALEQGEVQGRCAVSWEAMMSNYSDWLAEDKVRAIVQFALTPHPDLADVPLVSDLARDETDREALDILLLPGEVGFPFIAPPGLLPEVRDMLRDAFDQVMRDPDLLRQAALQDIDISPVSGEELQRVVEQIYAYPPETIARAQELIMP